MAPESETSVRVTSAHQRVLAPGEVVFEQGEAGDELFVVHAGEIELTRRAPGGPRRVARYGPGEFFGELSAVQGARRTARAAAVGAATVLRLDRETLEAMCVSQPEIALRLIRGMAARLLDAERRLARIDADEVLRPLVQALVRAAEPDAQHGSRIPLTLRGLAESAGLGMLEAHHALQLLFERGALSLVDACLVAPDLARLSESGSESAAAFD